MVFRPGCMSILVRDLRRDYQVPYRTQGYGWALETIGTWPNILGIHRKPSLPPPHCFQRRCCFISFLQWGLPLFPRPYGRKKLPPTAPELTSSTELQKSLGPSSCGWRSRLSSMSMTALASWAAHPRHFHCSIRDHQGSFKKKMLEPGFYLRATESEPLELGHGHLCFWKNWINSFWMW